MGKPQRWFGNEFEAEAIRLVETSGPTQREIAEDLGIGLATPARQLAGRPWPRDLEIGEQIANCAADHVGDLDVPEEGGVHLTEHQVRDAALPSGKAQSR